MKAIRKVASVSTEILNRPELIDSRILPYYMGLKDTGWTFVATTQTRGWCRYQDKVITIPVAVINRENTEKGYFTWYLSHEMAHAYVGYKANHGIVFQKQLQKICPPEYIKYEMRYKGTNATRAGIHSIMEMSLEELM